MADPEKIDETTLELSELTTEGLLCEPARVGLYGMWGVGKTTWISKAPRCVFLSTERGTNQIPGATRIEITSFDGFRSGLLGVLKRKHKFRTLAIDTTSALEAMMWADLCVRAGVGSIEEIDNGYGKGFNRAVEAWGLILSVLDRIRLERGMNIVLSMHAKNAVYKNPEGQDYNRFSPAMHDKSVDRIVGWLDTLLFMGYRPTLYGGIDPENKRGTAEKPGKMLGELERVITTVRGDGKEAKNRYQLPDELGDDPAEFWQRIAKFIPEVAR
jgi:hypothetical protein